MRVGLLKYYMHGTSHEMACVYDCALSSQLHTSAFVKQKCGLQALSMDTLIKVQVVSDEKDSLVICMRGRRPIRVLVRCHRSLLNDTTKVASNAHVLPAMEHTALIHTSL
jgi:hypothetical protein